MPATRLRVGLRRVEQLVAVTAGLACGLRGWSYLPPAAGDSVPMQLAYLDGVVPLWAYALMWMAVLPLGVASVWSRRLWLPTMAAVAVLATLWCLSFIASWLLLDVSRAWLSATSFGLVAVFAGAFVKVAALGERLAGLVDAIVRGGRVE